MCVCTKHGRMRPQTQTTEQELYECFNCGARTKAAGSCECGGELRHIGRSRDL